MTKSNFLNLVDKTTSIFLLKRIKSKIKSDLELVIPDEYKLKLVPNILLFTLLLSSLALSLWLKNLGQIWYVKVMFIMLAIILPYYVVTLVLEWCKYKINSDIPKLIDEFRSAFIEHRKIRPALKQSAYYIGGGLGSIISKASDASDIDKKLFLLREKISNTWFSIFVSLIINFKENGGEIVNQLYKLNNTMTRYNNIEKKKNRRLLLYEVFAILAAIFSVPIIYYVNNIILGSEYNLYFDMNTNIIVSKIVAYSIISLIVIRILRKT